MIEVKERSDPRAQSQKQISPEQHCLVQFGIFLTV